MQISALYAYYIFIYNRNLNYIWTFLYKQIEMLKEFSAGSMKWWCYVVDNC